MDRKYGTLLCSSASGVLLVTEGTKAKYPYFELLGESRHPLPKKCQNTKISPANSKGCQRVQCKYK